MTILNSIPKQGNMPVTCEASSPLTRREGLHFDSGGPTLNVNGTDIFDLWLLSSGLWHLSNYPFPPHNFKTLLSIISNH